MRLVCFCLLLSVVTLPAAASDLERALVGRRIVTPFDIPVHAFGVDFDGDRDFARDDASRIDRLETWGMAFVAGDTLTIREVRVSRKRIELIFERGGLSTTDLMMRGDARFWAGSSAGRSRDPGPHTAQDPARQSQRERVMVSGETGRSANRAQDAREHRAVADTAGQSARRALASEAGYVLVRGVGSRIRVHWKNEVPAAMRSPAALMGALSEHVIFLDTPADVPAGAEPH